MKLLQRYILGELLRVFLLLVVVLTVLLVLVGLVREATEHGLGPAQILQILPYVVPGMLPFTIPATLLLAITVVYGRLAGDLEVTAGKAAGVNPRSMLMPAFLLGAVLTFGSFFLTDQAIPWAMGNIERVVTQAMEQIFLDVLSSQHYISRPADGYSVTVHDVRDGVLIDPTFRYRNKDHQQITVKADAAKIRFHLEENEVRMALRNASVSAPGRDFAGTLAYRELVFDLQEKVARTKPRHMTIAGINERIADLNITQTTDVRAAEQLTAMLLLTGDFSELNGARMQDLTLKSRGADSMRNRYRTEINSRYAMAVGCFCFALVGGPFAVLQAKRQFITAFFMCFLPILLVYYPLLFLMMNLGKTGSVDPTWGMWVPNIVLFSAGLWMLHRVCRH